MAGIELLERTGIEKVDLILQGFIGVMEISFPGRVRCYYLGGSYSDGTGIDIGKTMHSSDLDLFVIFKERLQEEDGAKFGELVRSCNQLSAIVLDAHPESEEDLCQEDKSPTILNMIIKDSSLLLYGEDIKDKIAPLPLDSYMSHVINHGFYHSGIARQNGKPPAFPLTVPLSYPLHYIEPEGEFYGYNHRSKKSNGELDQDGTRLLVAMALWPATIIMGLKTGRYTGTKGGSVRLYRETVNDEWTPLVEAIFNKCKIEWHYTMPSAAEDRQFLRDLCRQVLDLENYAYGLCKDYLLGVLEEKEDCHKLEALVCLQSIVYPGDEIVNALKRLESSENAEVRETATQTLAIQQKHLKVAESAQ